MDNLKNYVVEIYNFVKDWGGHILSLLGIAGNVFIYLKHGYKLNVQKEELNDFSKELNKMEINKHNKAIIVCNIIKQNEHQIVLRISNIGEADARNVHVRVTNFDIDKYNFISKNLLDCKVVSAIGGICEEKIETVSSTPEYLELQITWDDNFSNGRTTNCRLYLH